MTNFKWGFFAAAGAFIVSFGIGLIYGVAVAHIFLRAFIFAAVSFGVGFGLRFLVYNFFPEFSVSSEGYTPPEDYEQQKGQRVNITLDTTGEYAVPELFKTPNAPDELGNIEDLVSGYFKPKKEGVDRIKEESYNQRGGYSSQESYPSFDFLEDSFPEPKSNAPSFESPPAPKDEKPVIIQPPPEFNPSFGDGSEGLGGLPDLDSMAMAFSPMGGHSPEKFTVRSSEIFEEDVQDSSFGFGSSDNDMDDEPVRYTGNKPQQMKGDFNPKEIAQGIRTVLIKDNK